MANQNVEQSKKKSRKWLWILLGSLLLGVFLMFFVGPHIGFLGFVGLLLFFFGPIVSLYIKSHQERKMGIQPQSSVFEKQFSQPIGMTSKTIRTSQKVAVVGTICFFLAILFFFIAWPIGLILLIVTFICTGVFYGFQSTEKAEDLQKIREVLEEKRIASGEGVAPELAEIHREMEIRPKKKTGKWVWVLPGIILFLILISLIGGGGEKKKIGSTQIFQPSIKKEVRIPLDQKIVITSMKKGFRAANYYAGEFQDFITFEIAFENKTDKDIRGVKGIVSFYDIFNEKIKDIEISYDKGINKHSQKIWNAQIEFNPFIDSDVKLKNTEGGNLSYEWKPTVIIYEDGTREE